MLSALWTFAMFNYLYADVLGLMDPGLHPAWHTGSIDGLTLSPGFLFGAAVLMEVPIVMTLLARLLPRGPNRVANIGAGLCKTVAVVGSLSIGSTTAYYAFFSAIEITTTVAIVVVAWRWPKAPDALPSKEARLDLRIPETTSDRATANGG